MIAVPGRAKNPVPRNIMASHVNLDALIPREDFAVSGPKETPKKTNVQIQELQPGAFFYESLRKPDFQRQTGLQPQGRTKQDPEGVVLSR